MKLKFKFKFNSIFLLLFSLLIFSPYVQSHSQISQIQTSQGELALFKTPSTRSLLSSQTNNDIDVREQTTLIVLEDGRLYKVETNSGEVIWSISTGDIMSSLHHHKETSKELVLDGGGNFNEIQWDDIYVRDVEDASVGDSEKMNLMKIVQGYLHGQCLTDISSIGQMNVTLLTVDSRSGKLIDVYDPSEGTNALVEYGPTDPENVLHVTRTDILVVSRSKKSREPLWRLRFSKLEASIDHEKELQVVPVVHFRDRTLVQFLHRLNYTYAKPSLPPKDNENSTSRVDAGDADQNSQPPFSIEQRAEYKTSSDNSTSLPPKDNENSTSLVDAGDAGQKSQLPFSIGPTAENTSSSDEKKTFHSLGLQYLAILCITSVFILWYTGNIPTTRQKSSEELNSSGGKNTVVAKRKKARKMANYKNDANTETNTKNISYDDIRKFNGLSSDKRNGKETWSNLEIPVDAEGNGRMIGKLFISRTEIAKGSNGTVVMEGIYDGRPVAVKRLVQAHHDVAYKEIQNLIASDRHPNIVRWYGVEYDSDFVYISLERCSCSLGDLIKMCSDSSCHSVSTQGRSMNSGKQYNVKLNIANAVNKHVELWKANGYPSPQLLRLMRDIVSGLVHLHELGIIHRDLKPQNILIVNEKSLSAKLSDMGISKRLVEDKSSLGHQPTGYGSSGWQAPEQLLHGRQTRAVDLFGLGCVLFFCITGGKHPYGDNLERDINIVKNRVDFFMVEHIPEAVNLFSHLLDPNPELRPTALYVLHHPLFWSSETRLSFLRDASDRVELEDRENESDLLKALESVGPVALGGYWDEKMESKFINNIGRYRRYKYDSTRDLLRVIRNKLNHYRELPKEIQEILGPVPEGFDGYFSNRFPNFLIEVYKVIYRYCREEECFWKYFTTV